MNRVPPRVTTGRDGPSEPAVRSAWSARLRRRLSTHNPFYLISAGLVFAGLRLSFDASADTLQVLPMAAGLACYALLLASTVVIVLRRGPVWDDARTMLLLVVLFLLAISVTFDDLLATYPTVGIAWSGGGWLFAILLSELTLRGISLRMPRRFRWPYYAMLTVFFLYPALAAFTSTLPEGRAGAWVLWGFGPAAGVAMLTLWPAASSGRREEVPAGCTWRWPWFPWTLFAGLAAAFAVRTWYLTIAFNGAGLWTIAWSFPIAAAALLLLLRMSTRHDWAAGKFAALLGLGMLLPAGLANFAANDTAYEFAVYQASVLGVSWPCLGLVALVGLYLLGCFRRWPGSWELLAVAVCLFSIVGPNTVDRYNLAEPIWEPLVAGAGILLLRALGDRRSIAAVGACLLLIAAARWLPEKVRPDDLGWFDVQAVLVGLLLAGTIGRDATARLLRTVGAVGLAVQAWLLIIGSDFTFALPPWHVAETCYAPAAALLLFCTARLNGSAFYLPASVAIGWSFGVMGQTYRLWCQVVEGLPYVVGGLLFFLVALMITLHKAGRDGQQARDGP